MSLVTRGDGHRFLTPSIITRESLMALMDHLVIPRLSSMDFQHYFANKIGGKISIKKPFQTTATDGRTLTKQPMIDEFVDINVNIVAHTALAYTADELTLDINSFRNRYLDRCAEELAYKYDERGGEEFHNELYIQDGTPGSALDIEKVHKMRAHWKKLHLPYNAMNCGLIDPYDAAALAVEIKDLENPYDVGRAVRDQYRGRLAGFRLYESNHIPPYVVADHGTGTPLVNYSVGSDTTYEGSSLPTDGWQASQTKVLNKGQLITIAGVYEIQPRGNRHALGRLKTFVVTEDVGSDASGEATVKISPELNAGGITTTDSNGDSVSKANFKNASAAAANNAAINLVGTKGKTYTQNVFFDKSCIQYANIRLERLESAGIKEVETEPQTGLSISLHADYGITNHDETQRLDILGAVKVTRPEVGIRYLSSEV